MVRGGLAWSWSMFAFGIVLALPAAALAIVNPSFSLAVAVGVVPAAASPLAPLRSGRGNVLIVGGMAALAMTLGSVLTHVPALAVATLFVGGLLAPLWAARSRIGALALGLALPLFGIGLSFSTQASALALGLLMIAGSAYAWLISLLWPESSAAPRAPATPTSPKELLGYGLLLGAAGGLAATLGYILELEHVGWVTGACLLVMRPSRSLLTLRSVGRALSVTVGALAAALFAQLSPSDVVLALVILLVLAAATATHGSRWYVTPGFTTFLALSLILRGPDESPAARFNERILETFIGIAIALLFGWLLPSVGAAFRAQALRLRRR